MYKLGVIGLGHMGSALVKGAVDGGALCCGDILVSELSPQRREYAQNQGYALADNFAELRKNSKYILLAAPPQVMKDILSQLAECEGAPQQVIITVAAAISPDYISSRLDTVPVIGIMTGAPLLIGKGATALCGTNNVPQSDMDYVKSLFNSVGITAEVTPQQLMSVVPANGSSPAYVYYFIHCIANAVSQRGVDYEEALKLTAQTFIGSAQLLLQSDKSAPELVDAICTPGGLTAQSMEVFHAADIENIIKQACDACIDRGYEIQKSIEQD